MSLPEVPLLGVLPGTGGLTRVTDKRHVRHDLADVFCTLTEGVRGQRAKDWRLVDEIAKPGEFAAAVRARAQALAERSDRPASARGVALTPLARTDDARGHHYEHVDVAIDRAARTATFTVRAPAAPQPTDVAGIEAAGARWWPLALARELDDAILTMRTNELDLGTWLLTTAGDPAAVLAVDATMAAHARHWLVRETVGLPAPDVRAPRRVVAHRCSRSSTADRASPARCSSWRSRPTASTCCACRTIPTPRRASRRPPQNFGAYPMVNGQTRLARRFYGDAGELDAVERTIGTLLPATDAAALGLVTSAPDDLDWDDEVRIALEERASMSPDALTGLEANLRFGGAETMETRIFGRLSAWQNWIFVRPNAVGEKGALKVYGKGGKAQFDFQRV